MNIDLKFFAVRPEDAPDDVAEARDLLATSGLDFDNHIELLVVCRGDGRLVACAGLDHNIIKCVAVAREFRGDSLSLRLGSEIISVAAQMGRFRLFLYSMPHNRHLFRGWGFYPLVEVPGVVILMENSPLALQRYCDSLRSQRVAGERIGCAVLNANPFTLGHQYLLERAAAECDWLHVFVVKEDASTFSYADRFAMVADGVKKIPKVTLHPGSEYIISRATFPGYFLKDKKPIAHIRAAIDLLLFRDHIAPALAINHRYVGTEPFDSVTKLYNADMEYWLQRAPSRAPVIKVVEVQRTSMDGNAISASAVRQLLSQCGMHSIEKLVPATTLEILERTYSAKSQLAVAGDDQT
ncbi:[citrate (pro-3S)-lyase] ligase [Edaphobacter sp. HDX4]|uniref:[citrate (pro-3S)-lyase] ligase n=1 Tax=Edaphobacter sp. HDX4 TaxID=2794064 RepID=UPI002FE514C6